MFTNTKKMLIDARKNGYAIGAFNIINLETIKSAVQSSQETNCPLILGASESAIKYAGLENLVSIVRNETKNAKADIALHLDHGSSIELCKKCIDAGFTSVMIDLSTLPFEENIKGTKEVVKYAHKRGVTVEAELGELKGVEDDEKGIGDYLTDPLKALEFINRTGVDSLAVSIGTAHGVNKGTKEPKIHYEILEKLEEIIPKDFPLVCHGASSVNAEIVNEYNASGGKLNKAQGINLKDLKKMATTTPISKINVDTDLRIVFTASLRKSLKENLAEINPRSHLKQAINRTKEHITYLSAQIFR